MIVLDRRSIFLRIKKAQLLLGFLLFFICCEKSANLLAINGLTMGTDYNIKVVTYQNIDPVKIKFSVDSILIDINKQMSTWDPQSEISNFNRWESLEPYKVSDSFLEVVKSSQSLSVKTDGMFDVTVLDLLKLWGFGPNPQLGIPGKKNIDSILSYTGFKNISFIHGSLIKKNKKTKIDLNAIAKGFGVDAVFNLIKSKGYSNIFVEIGGEVRFSGNNSRDKKWSVGLENPPTNTPNKGKLFFGVLSNQASAVATSANYRNYVDLDGTLLGHTINPKTGFPIMTNVLSVTVISKTCMEADGWATALMTMNYEEGSRLIKSFKNINAVWLLNGENDSRYIMKSKDCVLTEAIYDIR